jgi:hypothetical protein
MIYSATCFKSLAEIEPPLSLRVVNSTAESETRVEGSINGNVRNSHHSNAEKEMFLFAIHFACIRTVQCSYAEILPRLLMRNQEFFCKVRALKDEN